MFDYVWNMKYCGLLPETLVIPNPSPAMRLLLHHPTRSEIRYYQVRFVNKGQRVLMSYHYLHSHSHIPPLRFVSIRQSRYDYELTRIVCYRIQVMILW
jgi:hypothetical protein